MARFAIGIDLGTSNTVLAYATLPPASGGAPGPITLFEVDQLIAPGQVAPLPLLPSARYHAAAGELAPGDLQYFTAPGQQDAPVVVGTYARKLGTLSPGRMVTSAKSWLSHPGVDRQAPILPWGSPSDVPKVSPVEASASYLAYLREAWNARFPQDLLEHQQIVLTVPASFDEAARALTLQAARMAGLPTLRLLEEPQAVFYDYLARHQGSVDAALGETGLVLVCDVGGGTTDLSLIRIDHGGNGLEITRIGVGEHLILGGDNMDLALAHLVESRLVQPHPADGTKAERLSAAQLSQLVERCRAAKEQLLAADAPEQVTVTLLGAGSRLIGAARSAIVRRDEVEQLILDGFMPRVDAAAELVKGRAGIVEFGLPYARDAAITRHVAHFLRRHAHAAPDTLLLNGGVFHAPAMGQRLAQTLGAWRGAPLRILHNDSPDLAVARGAVAYALTGSGLTPAIGGGAARSYFLLLGGSAKGDLQRAVCILPRGSEAGRELRVDAHQFALRVGEPVRFHLVTSNADLAGRAPFALGELIDLDGGDFAHLPPVATVLPARGQTRAQIPVQLATQLSEVGTLEVRCVSVEDARQRWLLEFDLRAQVEDGEAVQDTGIHAARLAQAMARLERIFGPKAQQVPAKEVKGLRAQLENALGARATWNTVLLRRLFDALLGYARARRRSADHERVWLNLAGYCLRPGYGALLDDWRVDQLWPLFAAGATHRTDKQVQTEWWTLWRRIAGGLDAARQQRLLDDFAANLEANQQGRGDNRGTVVRGSDDDMLRLGSSLERIPASYKEEIGQWLLGRLGAANDTLTLWALGRLGGREPVYGNIDDVVAGETVAAWLEAILALNWRKVEGAAFAAANLGRVTGDRARDLSADLRETVAARLKQVGAPTIWVRMVSEVVVLDEATERLVLGETLPPGLRLLA